MQRTRTPQEQVKRLQKSAAAYLGGLITETTNSNLETTQWAASINPNHGTRDRETHRRDRRRARAHPTVGRAAKVGTGRDMKIP